MGVRAAVRGVGDRLRDGHLQRRAVGSGDRADPDHHRARLPGDPARMGANPVAGPVDGRLERRQAGSRGVSATAFAASNRCRRGIAGARPARFRHAHCRLQPARAQFHPRRQPRAAQPAHGDQDVRGHAGRRAGVERFRYALGAADPSRFARAGDAGRGAAGAGARRRYAGGQGALRGERRAGARIASRTGIACRAADRVAAGAAGKLCPGGFAAGVFRAVLAVAAQCLPAGRARQRGGQRGAGRGEREQPARSERCRWCGQSAGNRPAWLRTGDRPSDQRPFRLAAGAADPVRPGERRTHPLSAIHCRSRPFRTCRSAPCARMPFSRDSGFGIRKSIAHRVRSYNNALRRP